ncbi:hypothetical protein T10_1710, partial [Trichinella papuae]
LNQWSHARPFSSTILSTTLALSGNISRLLKLVALCLLSLFSPKIQHSRKTFNSICPLFTGNPLHHLYYNHNNC